MVVISSLLTTLVIPLGGFLSQPFVSASSNGNSGVTVPKTLNLTAIAVNAQHESILQCWELTSPFLQSKLPGTAGAITAQLGETNLTSYSLLPPRFDGGLHNAPAVQYVAFLAGLAHISLPNSTGTATVHGGRNGLIIAADIKSASTYGHITKYPGHTDTVVLQIPLAENKVPPHTVLHSGPCRRKEEDNVVT